ncbi:NAD-dependent deacylase [Deinococcus rubellus]|uniref:NAD-dependent protein deacylase n=1 Tax=Deinococcus rubellus TaxID=1889240 RepID=A0ABY5YHM7_9DEIO|nr:NAD-dependent deacylase [Deinococcus rubellus]UWX64315.1 NAD-dependent deacylase [Deinococcus rubellus]
MTDLEHARQCLQAAHHVAVMTGAGISAESGIPTFRAAQTGHWARFKPEDLASPQAYWRDPETVWAWYAGRCREVRAAAPNPGHLALAALERRKRKAETDDAETGSFLLATQNVDGLHQRAGSRRLVELHGNLTRARCERCSVRQPLTETEPFTPPHCPACGAKMRPDVVWFGENLPPLALAQAEAAFAPAQVTLVIGTSSVVEPAASLALLTLDNGGTVIEINPEPTPLTPLASFSLPMSASRALPALLEGWQ